MKHLVGEPIPSDCLPSLQLWMHYRLHSPNEPKFSFLEIAGTRDRSEPIRGYYNNLNEELIKPTSVFMISEISSRINLEESRHIEFITPLSESSVIVIHCCTVDEKVSFEDPGNGVRGERWGAVLSVFNFLSNPRFPLTGAVCFDEGAEMGLFPLNHWAEGWEGEAIRLERRRSTEGSLPCLMNFRNEMSFH
ncbi:hypothetical protein CDAR_191781 [Caerostris darwini]|uniref:Uncharacterized protein n=1 Tax=Caerostris darwini TaxID=1538125 RepID=A0AAV4P8C6_9ARAC|nr:hypothetical protein CDAR_191781 [Caerostris darwini]